MGGYRDADVIPTLEPPEVVEPNLGNLLPNAGANFRIAEPLQHRLDTPFL